MGCQVKGYRLLGRVSWVARSRVTAGQVKGKRLPGPGSRVARSRVTDSQVQGYRLLGLGLQVARSTVIVCQVQGHGLPGPGLQVARDVICDNLQPPNGEHLSTGKDAPPPHPPLSGSDHGAVFPTLSGVTDIIASSIPSLAGFASSIGGFSPSAPLAPPAPLAPSAPPSMDSPCEGVAAHIPTFEGPASAVANRAVTLHPAPPSAPPSNTAAVSLDRILSSLANIPSLAGIVSNVANPAVSAVMTPAASSDPLPKLPEIVAAHTDIGALSQLVMSTVDPDADITLPPLEGAAEPTEEGNKQSPYAVKENRRHSTMLACWTSTEEAESDSSNEEEDTGASQSLPGVRGPMGDDPAPDQNPNTNLPSHPAARLVPKRPALPPPQPPGQSGKLLKQKTPRAATIRVSRKKGASGGSAPQSAVVRASWLDVWKGFKHNVLWATLDGQLMSLWKKRTDQFSEVLFHVSSVTKVKKQDKGRFSVYFKKKHYDFVAHSDEVHEGWVTSLLASRGTPSPAPPELHGPITIKEPRSRSYAALWGHDLWIYPNKEGFQLGIASFSIALNVASVKPKGKHSFTLNTPYRTFSLSVDSSKELSTWLDSLSSSICSALSSSQVALRLWENPENKVCGDCGSANPEWASVNLLLVICQACAGQHRALGSSLSKVRSLKMDNKIWTEPLLQLFLRYGNRLANQVWAPAVPAAEQLRPESSDEERSKFIQDKYRRGRYRRVHALTTSRDLMDQRLRQVVCGDDVEETMSLICSGAKVRQTDLQSPAPILLAERANQALQTELLRLNEYTDVPPHLPQSANRRRYSAPLGEEDEELHGKLEEDRFLFSLENQSAACDVLDLREVLSVFLKDVHQFEMVTLSDQLICAADSQEVLLTHLHHILKVILPGGVSYAEVGGASAVSKVCVVEVGGASSSWDAWALLWEDGVSVYPVHSPPLALTMDLSALTHHEMGPSENIITMVTADRNVALRFEEQHSCQSWFSRLQRALTNQRAAPLAANQSPARRSLYPVMSRGLVPTAVERCISHITAHGRFIIPPFHQPLIPPDLPLFFHHSHSPLLLNETLIPLTLISVVQVYSQVNRMSAQNLALVLVPTLFQTPNQHLLRLTRELIIHHALLFLTAERGEEDEITVLPDQRAADSPDQGDADSLDQRDADSLDQGDADSPDQGDADSLDQRDADSPDQGDGDSPDQGDGDSPDQARVIDAKGDIQHRRRLAERPALNIAFQAALPGRR
ncbi:arf-GAP with Rho-GAP domain, ANK repeat and PH domain-containing protein 1 [Etheostoma cragini]|uniref:arf-GAP with Rho-GAP domain, ANK repeat and PH domain-containing protein 1 n=1 Tax=Etheostoma cragini TaxID=417921 RepID=UPI00155EA457|nr:arf-GAP with Rho-GAP domain, ANK repeat and PH domain-containing protein 1 [Etheostoma cragini]